MGALLRGILKSSKKCNNGGWEKDKPDAKAFSGRGAGIERREDTRKGAFEGRNREREWHYWYHMLTKDRLSGGGSKTVRIRPQGYLYTPCQWYTGCGRMNGNRPIKIQVLRFQLEKERKVYRIDCDIGEFAAAEIRSTRHSRRIFKSVGDCKEHYGTKIHLSGSAPEDLGVT